MKKNGEKPPIFNHSIFQMLRIVISVVLVLALSGVRGIEIYTFWLVALLERIQILLKILKKKSIKPISAYNIVLCCRASMLYSKTGQL
jgi:hypothetical protein